jgi:glycosyltransferase involved in cell wall biosynthesis
MTSIVVLVDGTHPYGAQRVALDLSQQLARRVRCTLVTYKQPASGSELAGLGAADTYHLRRRLGGVLGAVELAVRLRRFVRREPVDAVVSFMEYANVVTALALVGTRTAHVMTQHGVISDGAFTAHENAAWNRLASRATYPRADAVVCVSDAVSEDLKTVMPRLRQETVVRIYNPVDRARLESAAQGTTPHEWMRPGSGLRVLVVVGALKPVKNQRFALEILAQLPQVFRLVLVGDGPDRGALELAARELGLQHRVAFVGWQQNAPVWMRHAETVLVPSHNEGFGLCAVEAASIGARVVVAASPGLVEVARLLDLETVGPGDLTSWVQALTGERPRVEAFPDASFALFEPKQVAAAYLDVVDRARGLRQRRAEPVTVPSGRTGGRSS